MQNLLSSLKDIPGVVGSFILNAQGQLVAREMPNVYPDTVFPELGRRMATVGEVIGSQTGSVQELLLKFDAYFLHVRCTETCFLSVLVSESVNYPALRMATNVALRQVADKIASTPILQPSPAPTPDAAATETAPGAATKSRRFWRGQLVE